MLLAKTGFDGCSRNTWSMITAKTSNASLRVSNPSASDKYSLEETAHILSICWFFLSLIFPIINLSEFLNCFVLCADRSSIWNKSISFVHGFFCPRYQNPVSHHPELTRENSSFFFPFFLKNLSANNWVLPVSFIICFVTISLVRYSESSDPNVLSLHIDGRPWKSYLAPTSP